LFNEVAASMKATATDEFPVAASEKSVVEAGFEPVRPQPEQLPDYEPLRCRPMIV